MWYYLTNNIDSHSIEWAVYNVYKHRCAETAQYGLEIIFKLQLWMRLVDLHKYFKSNNWMRFLWYADTLIIPDIQKTEFSYCFIRHSVMEIIQKLLCEMQVDFICISKNVRINAPRGPITQNHSLSLALFGQRYITHVHCTRYISADILG